MTEDGKVLSDKAGKVAEKMTEKLAGEKKLRKDQCLIMILIGVLLCVIALPVKKDSSKSDISNTMDDTIGNHILSDTAVYDPGAADTEASYAGYWERKLEEALKEVDGVGRVKVLITLRESEHRIVEKDGPETYSETTEEDSAGGRRTTGETKTEKNTVYTTNENGREVPYVVMTVAPTVEGVVVIAQGGGIQSVQENIIEAIQVLFDIEANKIKIVKMKNIQ